MNHIVEVFRTAGKQTVYAAADSACHRSQVQGVSFVCFGEYLHRVIFISAENQHISGTTQECFVIDPELDFPVCDQNDLMIVMLMFRFPYNVFGIIRPLHKCIHAAHLCHIIRNKSQICKIYIKRSKFYLDICAKIFYNRD